MSSEAVSSGRRIREIRHQRGLSAQGLANETGLSRASVARIEAGKANPMLDSLAKIAAVLGVPVRSFFEEPADDLGVDGGDRHGLPSEPDGQAPVPLRDPLRSVSRQSELALMIAEHGTEAMWTEPGLYWRLELPPSDRSQEVVICVVGRQVGEAPYELMEHPQDEFLVVLDGTFDVTVGSRTSRLQEGDAIHLSGAKPHQYQMVGDEPARLILTILPQASRPEKEAGGHR